MTADRSSRMRHLQERIKQQTAAIGHTYNRGRDASKWVTRSRVAMLPLVVALAVVVGLAWAEVIAAWWPWPVFALFIGVIAVGAYNSGQRSALFAESDSWRRWVEDADDYTDTLVRNPGADPNDDRWDELRDDYDRIKKHAWRALERGHEQYARTLEAHATTLMSRIKWVSTELRRGAQPAPGSAPPE